MNPLLRDLLVEVDPGDLLAFHELSRSFGCPRGQALYTPGETPRGLTIISGGRVLVDREGERIAEIAPGGYFGERTLIAEEPIGVHLRALEDTECLEFPAAAARQFIHDHPAFGVSVLKALFTGNLARLSATSRAFLEKRALAAQLEARNRELSESLARLAALQAELVRAQHLASLGTMVAGVAHEINNPLAYVLQSLSTALERAHEAPPELAARLARPLERAQEGADRIRTIVSDLRGGAHHTGTSDVDREIAAALRKDDVHARAASLAVERPTEPPAGAAAIAGTQLGQVLLNLLRNAVDASPPGATVTIDAVRHAHVTIRVRDRGPGIPPDVRARMFDPFFTTKPVGKGSGLGLWVSQGIVLRAGGSIACDTGPDGTTFTITIPAGGDPR